MLWHPEFATRSCQLCLKYLYDDDTGRLTRDRNGDPEERETYNRVIPNTSVPLCQKAGKTCPKGTPENQKTLHPINQRCLEHYLECRAVGNFPDDPMVRRNAAIIRKEFDAFEKYQKEEQHDQLIQLLIAGA